MARSTYPRYPRYRLLAGSAIAALALAGCSAGGTDDSDSSSGSQSFSLAYAVTNSAVENPYEALAHAYMDANPDVTITLNEIPNDSYGQTLNTQLNAGNSSDVFQTAPGVGQGFSVISLAEADQLAPLGDAAEGAIPQGSESQFQIDDETYGVALGVTFTGIVANATTLDASGADLAEDWDDLLASCAVAADANQSVFALAGASPNGGLMALSISATRVYADDPDWNADRASGDVTFADTPGWVDTLDAVVDMQEAGCFQPGAEGGGFDAITNGLIGGSSYAAFLPSNSAADLSQNAPDAEFVVAPFPAAPGGEPFGLLGSNYAVSLSSGSKNADTAQAFLDWVASDEGQSVYAEAAGSFTLTADLSGTVFEPIADIIADGSYTPLPNSSWPNASVYDALVTGVQGLLTGQNTAADVLSSMDTAWEQ